MRYDLGGGYLAAVTALYNDGKTIGGLIYHTAKRWRLEYDGEVLHEWESSTEEDPAEMYDKNIAHLIDGNDERKAQTKNRFLRTQSMTARSAAADLAEELWRSGRALDFLCETCSKVHVGDKAAIKAIIYAYASTRVLNSDGIHISISGNAGSGKSHAVSTAAQCLPLGSVSTSRLSNKALLYHDLKPKTVIVLDDQELNEDMQELIKVHTSGWDDPPTYKTVMNGKPIELQLPSRCPFVVCKVNLNGDEQILDRQLVFWTDESKEQKQAVSDALMKRASNPGMGVEEEKDMVVCRAIWNYVPQVVVSIPFADRIGFNEWMDARNIKMMISLIQTNALMHAAVREMDEEGNLVASEEDFYAAADLMNPLLNNVGGSQRMKLSANASKVLAFLAEKWSGEIPFSEIRRATGMSTTQLSNALFGRNDAKTDGLLSSCNALEVVTLSESVDDGVGRKTVGNRKAIRWSRETYEAWVFQSMGGFWLK